MIKIVCKYGFYKFYPDDIAELKFLSNHLGVELVRDKDYYTFPVLAKMQNFICKSWSLGDVNATVTYAGDKGDIFRVNNARYNIALAKIDSNSYSLAKLNVGGGAYYSSPNLVQAYVIDYLRQRRVTGFLGFFDYNFNMFQYEEFYYD